MMHLRQGKLASKPLQPQQWMQGKSCLQVRFAIAVPSFAYLTWNMLCRLGRLESMLERLVKTLESESRIPGLPSPPHTAKWSCAVSGLEPKHTQPSKDESRLAPMFLIRDAAMESKASVSPSPPGMSLAYPRGDVISNGLITEEFASSLIEL